MVGSVEDATMASLLLEPTVKALVCQMSINGVFEHHTRGTGTR
jgi:hypothetical protein